MSGFLAPSSHFCHPSLSRNTGDFILFLRIPLTHWLLEIICIRLPRQQAIRVEKALRRIRHLFVPACLGRPILGRLLLDHAVFGRAFANDRAGG